MASLIMEVTLREARESDRPLLARLFHELRAAHGDAGFGLDAAGKRLALLLGAGYRAYVGEAGGEAVGYALARDNGDHLFIRHFVIEPSRRGRGLGRAFARALADHHGWPELRLDVIDGRADARAFWERLGFAPAAVNMRLPAFEEF